ncbi:MAG: glutamate 5-kinase [Rhodobacterales bacterium]|nr:MAG: glutamate 5-kinase [Rhodobacterales bacterium]
MATLSDARRVVVKIGSALLVKDGGLREEWLASLCDDVANLKARSVDVVLVSSGSIALGRGVLGLSRDVPLEQAQAAAAVGQIRLARAYEAALAPHGITAAQVLVTLEDVADRRRYLNSRATLGTLLGLGAVPIVNENDTVATDEIRYGDNDRLAAQVAVTVGADVLILLSDVDGLYTANPMTDPSARRYDIVEQITPEIEAQAGEGVSGLSKGGMRTKLMAARIATEGGCAMAITSGTAHNPLKRLEGDAPSTWFAAQASPQQARKGWITAMPPRGQIRVDAGAARALAAGKSLLPAGIVSAEGAFTKGDPVEITGPDGARLATGLSRYAQPEVEQMRGHQSGEIASILGYEGPAVVVHRDDMAQ